MKTRSFSSKILLFGEHTVLQDSYAIALPFDKMSGKLSFSGKHNEGFKLWLDYIKKNLPESDIQNIDLEQLKQEIDQGLGYNSTIPIGYGLGSSGSVTAAIFDRYFDTSKYDFNETKNVLGRLESFFHGKSSGLDPVVSFFNKAVLVSKKDGAKPIDKDLSSYLKGFHLIDSQMPRSTETYVKIFLDKMNNSSFSKAVKEMSSLNNDLIEDFQNGIINQDKLKQLSVLQFENVPELIPEKMAALWEDGLQSGEYTMKLCGAGGGGMFLAYGNIGFETIML